MNALTKISASDTHEISCGLQIFNYIPRNHGVVAVAPDDGCTLLQPGEVAVYDEWDLRYNSLQENALYVREYQSTPAGMPRQQFAEAFIQYASRLVIQRDIVRISRFPGTDQERWCCHPLKSVQGGVLVFSDGPFDQFYLTNTLIGKVVGVYRPALGQNAAPVIRGRGEHCTNHIGCVTKPYARQARRTALHFSLSRPLYQRG